LDTCLSIKWYDLKEKDEKPLDPTRHPYYRHNKFFDSTGPGGVRTPRRDHYDTPPEHRISKKDLQIDRQYIHPFAHNGYVYCMLLVEGVVTDDPEEEVLVSGSGDGTINVWSLQPAQSGRIKELFTLGGNGEDREPVYSLALDGTFLISGRSNGEVNIWDLETRQLMRTLKSKVNDVRTLSIGGSYLFTAGSNGKVEVIMNTLI
jgi:di- and tripeptidase